MPSALRSGVGPELWGPYIVLSASKNFFISFLSAKDWISSAFLLSQESCMSPSCSATLYNTSHVKLCVMLNNRTGNGMDYRNVFRNSNFI